MKDNIQLRNAALIAEIIGGFAVLVTLIFLVYQTSEGVKATRAQTAQAVFQQIQSANDTLFFGERERRELWAEFNENGYEDLDPGQVRGATLMLSTIMQVYDNAYYQYRQNVLDEEVFDRFRLAVQNRASRSYFPEYWERSKDGFTASFQAWVNELMQSKNREGET